MGRTIILGIGCRAIVGWWLYHVNGIVERQGDRDREAYEQGLFPFCQRLTIHERTARRAIVHRFRVNGDFQ